MNRTVTEIKPRLSMNMRVIKRDKYGNEYEQKLEEEGNKCQNQ